jgi:WG containing repeat
MLIPYSKNNIWGFCNPKREIVIDCQYDGVSFFKNGLAIVRRGIMPQDREFAFIDENGKLIVPFLYGNMDDFSEGLAKVRQSGQEKYGFMDAEGNQVIPCKFISAGSFAEGLAYALKGDNTEHFIDQQGKTILSLKPSQSAVSRIFSEGWTVIGYEAARGELYQLINQGGEALNNQFYLHATNFEQGLAKVCNLDGHYSFINPRGEMVIDCRKYSYVADFQDDMALVQKGNLFGFINRTGEEVIPCVIDFWVRDFSEGLAKVKIDNLYGFMDKELNLIFPCMYSQAENFTEGFAVVQYPRGDYAFINHGVGLLIYYFYDFASSFSQGFAFVRKGEYSFYIDRKSVEYYEK